MARRQHCPAAMARWPDSRSRVLPVTDSPLTGKGGPRRDLAMGALLALRLDGEDGTWVPPAIFAGLTFRDGLPSLGWMNEARSACLADPRDHNRHLPSMRNRSTAALWIAGAFSTALVLAAAVLAALAAGERGTHVALQATARLSFVLFWPAYSAAALGALFGPSFQPLQRRCARIWACICSRTPRAPRVVAWLGHIGHAPSRGSFIFFGIAALCTHLLALFSIARPQRALGASGGWLLRIVVLNYIAFAFAVDFLRLPASGSAKYLAGYCRSCFFQCGDLCCALRRSANASSHPQASSDTGAT
jgi:hypothetical protein